MKGNLLAGVTRFAHLGRPAAVVPPKAAKADDDEMENKGPNDEGAESEDGKEKAESDDDEGDDASKSKKAKKAKKAKKKNDDGEDDEEDDDDDEEGDDDGDEDEMSAESPARAARMRERARCAAIFADPAAAANPGLAAHLAFETALSRSQAIAVLHAGGAATGSRLATRMAGVPSPRVGPGDVPGPTGAAAIAARIIANHEAARGRKQG